jgi:F-type H+-transporting ATPase subunit b
MLLASSGEEPPVIDIDGTVLVQFGLFVLLFFALRHLLFRPYLELQRLRSEGIDGAKQAADNLSVQAQDMMKDYERRMAEARTKAEEERMRLRNEGQRRSATTLSEARDISQAKLQAARKQIAVDLHAAKARLQQEAQPLAHQIASKVLGRVV